MLSEVVRAKSGSDCLSHCPRYVFAGIQLSCACRLARDAHGSEAQVRHPLEISNDYQLFVKMLQMQILASLSLVQITLLP